MVDAVKDMAVAVDDVDGGDGAVIHADDVDDCGVGGGGDGGGGGGSGEVAGGGGVGVGVGGRRRRYYIPKNFITFMNILPVSVCWEG